MDQQQATHFILEQLKLGYSKIDVAADLSQRLGAPTDLVMRFVNQVASSNIQQQPSIEIEIPAAEEDQYILEPMDNSDHEWENNGLADNGLGGIILEDNDYEISYSSDPYGESYVEDVSENISDESIRNQTTHPDQEKYAPLMADVDREKLTTFIVQRFKQHHRHNDIIETVCRKTGMSWDQAQRFVARTQTEHHKELTKSSRSIMTPLSIGFIIGGFLLLIWSILTMFDYYRAFTSQEYSTIPIEFIFLVGGAFVTSFGIMIGGVFGLYKTFSNQ